MDTVDLPEVRSHRGGSPIGGTSSEGCHVRAPVSPSSCNVLVSVLLFSLFTKEF